MFFIFALLVTHVLSTEYVMEEITAWNDNDQACKDKQLSKKNQNGLDICKNSCLSNSLCGGMYFATKAEVGKRKDLCVLYEMDFEGCTLQTNKLGTNYKKVEVPETDTPTMSPSAPPGHVDMMLKVMPANSGSATTSNAISVSFMKFDDSWTAEMELFESCTSSMYCGKEFVIEATGIKAVQFLNNGADNFKVGKMMIYLDGKQIYPIETDDMWVTTSKSPIYKFTAMAPCPTEGDKIKSKVKIQTAPKGNAATTDTIKMAFKTDCSGWAYPVELSKTGLGDKTSKTLKKVEPVEKVMFWSVEGTDNWKVKKVDLFVGDEGKQKLIPKSATIGLTNDFDNAHVFPAEETEEDIMDFCTQIPLNGACAEDCSYMFSNSTLAAMAPDWVTIDFCNTGVARKYTQLCPSQCGIEPLCAHVQMTDNCEENCIYALTDISFKPFLKEWIILSMCESDLGTYHELCPMECPYKQLGSM